MAMTVARPEDAGPRPCDADTDAAAGPDWQRGMRLADWALYYGKARGRNQARIVTHLHAPIDTVLEMLDAGKDGQPRDGLIDMECVPGPEQNRMAGRS